MPAYAGIRLGQPRRGLAGDGVGGLVAAFDQRAKRVDEVFDLSFLHAEEIELPCDLVQFRHGLFIGYAIGIHVYLSTWRSVASGELRKSKVGRGYPS